jgi:NAD dependent epimerase/dehydratase family enzyme
MSWIALDDLIGLIFHLLMTPNASGAFNAVAPEAVTQRTFIRTLGRVLHRPAKIPMPAPVVRLLFGEMGQELLLASTRVSPTAAVAAGFKFLHPDLEGALRFELGLA